MPGLGGTQRLTKIIGEKKGILYILTNKGLNLEDACSLNIA